MRLPDVNILVNAYRVDAHDHHRYATWLNELLAGPEFGMSELVVSGFLRVLTNTRVFAYDTRLVLAFANSLVYHPKCVRLRPGPRNWDIFRELCETSGVSGADVSDAYHAALAIEHDCEWITADRGFARFPGLRWSAPF